MEQTRKETELSILIKELNDQERLILQWADNGLIMNHRLCEWCAHAPELEIEMGLANIALDHLGHARLWLAELEERLKKRHLFTHENQLTYFREDHQFFNLLIIEQPNQDFAMTITKMFLYDAYHQLLLKSLIEHHDQSISAIAQKARVEVNYHLKFSQSWVETFVHGTDESTHRMKKALNFLWNYVGEFFSPSTAEKFLIKSKKLDLQQMKSEWLEKIQPLIEPLQLDLDKKLEFYQPSGKENQHTENLSHLLSEMQVLARKHPGARW